MIQFSASIRVYVNFEPVDFRRGLDGLLSLIQSTFDCQPQEDYLFLFCDGRCKKIKAVFWDKNGFVLLYKRLEVGRFQFPKNRMGKIELTRLQLECLLSGMSFISPPCAKPHEYCVFN